MMESSKVTRYVQAALGKTLPRQRLQKRAQNCSCFIRLCRGVVFFSPLPLLTTNKVEVLVTPPVPCMRRKEVKGRVCK